MAVSKPTTLRQGKRVNEETKSKVWNRAMLIKWREPALSSQQASGVRMDAMRSFWMSASPSAHDAHVHLRPAATPEDNSRWCGMG